MLRTGLLGLLWAGGWSGAGRFFTFGEQLEGLHARDVKQPHWYLWLLAVDPPFQGKGLGGALLCLCAPALAAAQEVPATDSLAESRRRFADAAYEPALAMLDRLRPSSTADLARDVEATRALCLLALGREPEAREALAAVIDLDPLFVFSESEVAPRVIALFSEVRAARLPGVVRQRFADAREAFSQKDYERAAAGFELVRTLLDLPELRALPEGAKNLGLKLILSNPQ